jgi:hypothetical protein
MKLIGAQLNAIIGGFITALCGLSVSDAATRNAAITMIVLIVFSYAFGCFMSYLDHKKVKD